MSDLIDRYLMAVSANLPKKDRADITAELRDILFSKVEAREEQLGHPLSKAEEEALLHEFGHPIEVAGRYGKTQYLIGPTVFPFYVFFLKVVLGIMVVIYIALWAMFVVAGGEHGGPPGDVAQALFNAFAGTTLTFIVFERTGVVGKWAAKWKPSQLPLMGSASGRGAFTVLFEMAMMVVFGLWWTGVITMPMATGPHKVTLSLAPIWHQLYWPILAMIVVQVALDLFELVAPGKVKAHAWARIGFHVVMLGLFAVIYQAGHWIDITVGAGARPDLQERLVRGFDNGFKIGIVFGALCAVYEIWCCWRRISRRSRASGLMPA